MPHSLLPLEPGPMPISFPFPGCPAPCLPYFYSPDIPLFATHLHHYLHLSHATITGFKPTLQLPVTFWELLSWWGPVLPGLLIMTPSPPPPRASLHWIFSSSCPTFIIFLLFPSRCQCLPLLSSWCCHPPVQLSKQSSFMICFPLDDPHNWEKLSITNHSIISLPSFKTLISMLMCWARCLWCWPILAHCFLASLPRHHCFYYTSITNSLRQVLSFGSVFVQCLHSVTGATGCIANTSSK